MLPFLCYLLLTASGSLATSSIVHQFHDQSKAASWITMQRARQRSLSPEKDMGLCRVARSGECEMNEDALFAAVPGFLDSFWVAFIITARCKPSELDLGEGNGCGAGKQTFCATLTATDGTKMCVPKERESDYDPYLEFYSEYPTFDYEATCGDYFENWVEYNYVDEWHHPSAHICEEYATTELIATFGYDGAAFIELYLFGINEACYTAEDADACSTTASATAKSMLCSQDIYPYESCEQ